jgi:multidrug efflux pump subunit AcrA (membrane-fusion protein)
MALQRCCTELEKELQAKSLLEAQVSRLEREKVRMTSHFNKMKLDRAAAIEYMNGSHAELTSAKQEIERLHAELRAAELTAERESSAAQQLRRQLQRAEDTQKGKGLLPHCLFLILVDIANWSSSSVAALESDRASKGEEVTALKTQLEQLSAAAEVAVNYLPSSLSSAELSLSNRLEQLPSRIREFVADKMNGVASMALA